MCNFIFPSSSVNAEATQLDISSQTMSPPPPPALCYYCYYYYCIPVPAVVTFTYPLLPQFFPSVTPSCSVYNPFYPSHCPLISPPPTAHAGSTTPKNDNSHESAGVLVEVKNKKGSSMIAPRQCRNVKKVYVKRVKALSSFSCAAPTSMRRHKSTKIETEGKCTLMVKNIPNSFSKEKLIGYIDKHCAEENVKNEKDVESAYDFVYLPIDFRSGCNLGYAFVNFTSVIAAVRFFRAYHGFKWSVVHDSPKVCEIMCARIQGRDKLESHFRKSRFICNTEEYLPTMFSPPRNGINSAITIASVIGTLAVRRSPY